MTVSDARRRCADCAHTPWRARCGRRRHSPRRIGALGFVQLDPIRAPARAADLILRHRVDGLSRRRSRPRVSRAAAGRGLRACLRRHAARRVAVAASARRAPPASRRTRASAAGGAHPRACGGARRDAPARSRGARPHADRRTAGAAHRRRRPACSRRCTIAASSRWRAAPTASRCTRWRRPSSPPLAAPVRARAILSLLLDLYAPLPEPTLRQLVRMVPESSLPPALLAKALEQLRHGPEVRRVTVDGVDWLLPARDEMRDDVADEVRLLAPFDPVVWDRRRFAAFWGWEYRLEAYTPPGKAQIGLLRAAVAVARRCRRLGQRDDEERHAHRRRWLRQGGAAHGRVPARARCRARTLAHVRRRRAVVVHVAEHADADRATRRCFSRPR